MTSEERQRELREQGSQPAEAQKQEQAASNRELLARADAERAARQPQSPDESAPLAEDGRGSPHAETLSGRTPASPRTPISGRATEQVEGPIVVRSGLVFHQHGG